MCLFICSGDPSLDASWAWSSPACVGAPPSPRTGATATTLPGGRFILIAGGWDPDNTEGKAAAAAAAKVKKKAAASSASSSASAAATVGGKRARGGASKAESSSSSSSSSSAAPAAAVQEEPRNDGSRPYCDIYLLDTWQWEWLCVNLPSAASSPSSSSAPTARVGHAAIPLCLPSGPAVALIGGVKGDQQRYNDVSIIHLPSQLLEASGVGASNSTATSVSAPNIRPSSASRGGSAGSSSGSAVSVGASTAAELDDDGDDLLMAQPDNDIDVMDM